MKSTRRNRLVSVLTILAACAGIVGCDRLSELSKTSEEEPVEVIDGYQGALVRDLSEEEFDEFRRIGGRLVVVDFHADWCPPCRRLGPVLEKLTHEFDGTVVLGKVNVDKAPNLKREMGVSGIPDVRIYLDGKEVERFKGALPEGSVKELFAAHAPLSVPTAVVAAQTQAPQQSQPEIQPLTKDWLPPGMQRK